MSGDLRIRVLPSIGEVPADIWDGCANPEVQAVSSLPAFNPFISHDFLSALEESRSVQARTGWQPQHLLAEDESGRGLRIIRALADAVELRAGNPRGVALRIVKILSRTVPATA